MPTPSDDILNYLAEAHTASAETEVSGAELQRELKLDSETVRACAGELAGRGLVEYDSFLSNVWLSITDKGLMTVARG